MKGVRWGIQGKLAAALFLLALLTMQFVSAFLLRSMEDYFLRQVRTDLQTTAAMVAGVVAGSLGRQPPALEDVDRFIRSYSSSLSGPSWQGRLVVVDPDEVVLASSSADVVPGQVFRRPEIRSGALEGEITEGQYTEGDSTFYTVAVPVQGQGRILGAVYLDAPLDGVYATLADLRRILLTATALAVVILTLLGLVVARTITGPLHALTAQAAAMARGDFRQLMPTGSGDELGVLAETFNYLSRRLDETLQAISDEKQRAEAILTYMADGMLALDNQGRVLMINPAAARLLAVRPVDAQGKPLARLWPDEKVQEALAESLAGSLASVQTRLSHPPRTVHARLAPLKVGEQVSGVVMVMRDVTEQEKVEAMRQEFVADVSHELKTPITTIKSYVQTLRQGALEDPSLAARFLGVIEGEVDRMTKIVNDLLQIARLEHGEELEEREPLQLEKVAEDMVEKLGGRAAEKGIELRLEAKGPVPPVLAHRLQMEQVFTNLLTNALDFTPAGGRVEVKVEGEEKEVAVTIRDTGIGIPPQDLPRIFERFYRVDKGRSREFGGTGLGLYITREIIRRHGGDIRIESQVGEGTVVTFTLPRMGEGYAREAQGS